MSNSRPVWDRALPNVVVCGVLAVVVNANARTSDPSYSAKDRDDPPACAPGIELLETWSPQRPVGLRGHFYLEALAGIQLANSGILRVGCLVGGIQGDDGDAAVGQGAD